MAKSEQPPRSERKRCEPNGSGPGIPGRSERTMEMK